MHSLCRPESFRDYLSKEEAESQLCDAFTAGMSAIT